jgi:hypothetical protein
MLCLLYNLWDETGRLLSGSAAREDLLCVDVNSL